MKRLFALLLCAALLVGCAGTSLPTDSEDESIQQIQYDWMAGESPVSSRRTGIDSAGIRQLQNSFECTSTGFYAMCDNWLLYCDHGSDEIIKLCGRPDCNHKDATCNAYFNNGYNVCFEDDHLYVVHASRLVQLEPDGTNRLTILDPVTLSKSGGNGIQSPHIWNGYFTIGLARLDENGNRVIQQYYALLDGNTDEITQTEVFMPIQNDGDNFIVHMPDSEKPGYYQWEPETNTFTFLTDIEANYYGSEYAYYMDGGVVCRLEYASGDIDELLDTGLVGNYRLHCFPDCMVISCTAGESQWEGIQLSRQILRFYNWEYTLLGEVELNYKNALVSDNPICGETSERILLTDNNQRIPTHYINKADLGTDTIPIHRFNVPEYIVAYPGFE